MKRQFSTKIKKPKIYNPHTDGKLLINNDNFIRIAIIDPGTTSCALRIVGRKKKFSSEIITIYLGILNFGTTMEDIINGVSNELNPLMETLSLCHYILIEKQPFVRPKFTNIVIHENVHRTFQHIISTISIGIKNKGVHGIIVEVDSKLKTCWFGGPATSRQNGGQSIKKWTKAKAIEIMLERNDEFSLSIFNSHKHKGQEDISDVICYEEAWWDYMFSEDSIPKL